jgi:hypothetical protein
MPNDTDSAPLSAEDLDEILIRASYGLYDQDDIRRLVAMARRGRAAEEEVHRLRVILGWEGIPEKPRTPAQEATSDE